MADWNDIIITKADKGWAVVIIDAKDYVKEAEYQFNNKRCLQKAPTWLNTSTYKIDQWHNNTFQK